MLTITCIASTVGPARAQSSSRRARASSGLNQALTKAGRSSLRRQPLGLAKASAALPILQHLSASGFLTPKQPQLDLPLLRFPAQLFVELRQAAIRFRLLQEEKIRQAAQLKLASARAQLIGRHAELMALPLQQHWIARTNVEEPAFQTPLAFRKQFTVKAPSPLSQQVTSACTCSSIASPPLSTKSWAEEEEEEDDFALPVEWGLSPQQLAQHGLVASAPCAFCSSEDLVDLSALRRPLPWSMRARIAYNARRKARNLGRNELLAYLFEVALQRASQMMVIC